MKVPVRIKLETVNASVVQRFERSLEQHSKIVEGHVVAGDADYLLFVSVQDLVEFEVLHRTVLATLPGVKSIRTDFLIRQVKPLNHPDQPFANANTVA